MPWHHRIGSALQRFRLEGRYDSLLVTTFFAGSYFWLNGIWWLVVSPGAFGGTPSYRVLALLGPEWAVGLFFIVSGVAPVAAQLLGASHKWRQRTLLLLLVCACVMFSSVTWANWTTGAVPIYGFSIMATLWAIYLEQARVG